MLNIWPQKNVNYNSTSVLPFWPCGVVGMGWYFASEQVPTLFTFGTQPVETLASDW